MDAASGFCLGCGRTEEEIAEWSAASDSRRNAIWSLLPERASELGIAITRLPWQLGRIAEFVSENLHRRAGTWVIGCHGAAAEFVCRPGKPCRIEVSGNSISAIAEGGALQLTIGEGVRALELRAGRGRPGFRAIFLVAVKAKVGLPDADSLTPLGPDLGAILPECRGEHLFDLGLGRGDLRFCVRTKEGELRGKLEEASGLPLVQLLQDHGAMILRHNPTRVVESTLGRAEIYTPIPPPGGQSPEGPHTHLFPGQLSSGRPAPPGIDLPPVYALGATFCPHASEPAEHAAPISSSCGKGE
ncbi:MAG: DUF1289 domain-containing protein [Beijerinckiaceae bacterium]|nr:DUF1289 domain-containing protein [Beijerinckiaceae bacterium]